MPTSFITDTALAFNFPDASVPAEQTVMFERLQKAVRHLAAATVSGAKD
jgi:hypothetical protein